MQRIRRAGGWLTTAAWPTACGSAEIGAPPREMDAASTLDATDGTSPLPLADAAPWGGSPSDATRTDGPPTEAGLAAADAIKATIRKVSGGTYILSGAYEGTARAKTDPADKGELLAYGRASISHRKRVSKVKRGAQMLPADPSTFCAHGPEGYMDDPVEA